MESYQQRVSRVLKGQRAPLIEGERHILARCGQCDRAWLLQGVRARLSLQEDELLQWAARLGADSADLPTMTCRACAVRYAGGGFVLDEYVDGSGQIRGYGYSWEAMVPPAHMLMGVFHLAWLSALGPQEKYSTIVTEPARARGVLAWLDGSTRSSLLCQPLSQETVAELSRTTPPGAHAPGTEGWVWRGASWQAQCDPLGGIVQVTFAWAGSSSALFALSPALAQWRAVARRAGRYGIAGETAKDAPGEEHPDVGPVTHNGDPGALVLSLLEPSLGYVRQMASSHPLVASGLLLFLGGEVRQAYDVLTRALEQDAPFPSAYLLRALASCVLEAYASAINDLTALLVLDSTHALAYELRGIIYAACGSGRAAITDFDAALGLRRREERAGLYEKRGEAYTSLGEHGLAAESFGQALALDPENTRVLCLRARAFLWLVDAERARADYALAWRLDPRRCDAWWMVEWIGLCLEPDTPEARTARLERLRQLASLCLRQGAAPHEQRLGRLCDGVVRWLAGDEAAAREAFEAQFAGEEGAGDTCYWLGMVLLSGGDVTGAGELFAAALDHGVPPVLFRFALHEPSVGALFKEALSAADDEAP